MAGTNNPEFKIVGIGASAGGLKAIKALFSQLPHDLDMAFVVVQHLSRKHKSLMKEILAKDTQMPVVMAEEGAYVEANHIYLIPAGKQLTIKDRKLVIQVQPDEQRVHFVIDTFFNSLGLDQKENSIGIILSGTGSDGSRGIRTIKNEGGIVIVQEPESGDFDGMPLSAIDTQIVDFILDPSEIARKLIDFRDLEWTKDWEEKMELDAEQNGKSGVELEMLPILQLVQKAQKTDFSQYKKKTIKRRVDKHMATYQKNDQKSYFQFLLSDPKYIRELYHELLIGVTEFFRDPKAFEVLEESVFQHILRGKSLMNEIRIWVCACSTGEEVYSLIIALWEYASKQGEEINLTVLATDINEQSLQIASKGEYPSAKLADLPKALIEKYFDSNGNTYEVKPFIRHGVVFSRNDATVDPPFINLDLISCRNLLIYLQPHVQKKLILNFHFGLRKDGFLWLGSSENLLEHKKNFEVLSEKWKVFKKVGETPKARKSNMTRSLHHTYFNRSFKPFSGESSNPSIPTIRNTKPNYERMLVEQYAPSCILVDEELNLNYIAGGAGKFIHLPDMELNHNLLGKVSKATGLVIRDALSRFKKDEQAILEYKSVQVLDDDPSALQDISVRKINSKTDGTFFLIEWSNDRPSKMIASSQISNVNLDLEVSNIIKDLQDELHLAKQKLQNSLEELQASNEELQASNEELIASNEELQSTNEEVQSVNEELYSVNSELQLRNRELTDANSTIDHLLSTTEIGLLFLDQDLHIKLFTPFFSNVLQLEENDIGTHIEKFNLKWSYKNFLKDAQYVLETGKSKETQVQAHKNDAFYLTRIYPFMQGDQASGVVLNLIDISKQKMSEMELSFFAQNHQKILDSLPIYVFTLKADGSILYINKSFDEYKESDLLGSNIAQLMDKHSAASFLNICKQVINEQSTRSFENLLIKRNGEQSRFQNIMVPIESAVEGNEKELLLTSIELSEERIISNQMLEEYEYIHEIFSNDAMIFSIKNEQFQYVYANNGFVTMFKPEIKELKGSNDFALFPHAVALQLRKNDEDAIAGNERLHTIETYRVNEKKIKASVLKFPVEGPAGGKLLIQAGIILDGRNEDYDGISETLSSPAIEKLVDERTSALEHANHELRAISRSMAHDLRGPLRAIHTYGEMLEETALDKFSLQQKDNFFNILHQSSRMNQIIDGLNSYLKLGSIEVQKEWIDLKALLEGIWQDLKYLRDTMDAKLIMRDCPPIWADLFLSKQILTNLLTNALKYRKVGKLCKIEVGAHKDPKADNLVYFIKDNGIGFSPKDSEKIFRTFERLPDTKVADGSGIGLSIVKKGIELQGGNIWAYSRLGQGATFSFTLPQKRDEVI